jgi:hypothetical protein
MIEVKVLGLGAWSDLFADARQLMSGLETGHWPDTPVLSPSLIPSRERRRAPATVKLAVEAMGQAQEQSGLAGAGIPVVTASSMGDMEITDHLCRVLADSPQLVSPTMFHNSVHNAAVGYWAISQASMAACNAVAAGEYSGTAGLLEAATLCQASHCPVLLVVYEGRAPATLMPLCRSPHPLALAWMLAPVDFVGGTRETKTTALSIRIRAAESPWPILPPALKAAFSHSPAGRLLPLFIALAGLNPSIQQMTLPVSPQSSLDLVMGSAVG